jgi:uncharacterized protein
MVDGEMRDPHAAATERMPEAVMAPQEMAGGDECPESRPEVRPEAQPETQPGAHPEARPAMRPDRRMLSMLVCPASRTDLIYDAARHELISRVARVAYPIRDGVPVMTRDEARPLDDEELRRLVKRYGVRG